VGSPAQSLRCVCFGEFKLDPRTGELTANGQSSYLQDKPLQVLALLLEHPGQLVTRDELMKRLWSADTFVDFDQSLNKAVNRLREALEDSTEHPRFIETLPRRGYRFIAPITLETYREPVSISRPAPEFVPRVSEWPAVPDRNDGSISGVEPANAASPRLPFLRRNWKYLTAIFAVVVIVALGFEVLRWRSRNRGFNLEKMQITKLTQAGNAGLVAISPDGRYVVYGLDSKQGTALWLRQVATRSEVQILPPEAVEYEGVSFSPDGNDVYFVHSGTKLTDFRYLYRMPALGGPVRLLAADVDSPVSFSPNGRQFVYTRGDPKLGGCEVRLANADGSGNRVLATIPETYTGFQPGAAWSPDGRTIAVPFQLYGKRSGYALKLVSIRDGRIGELYSGDTLIGRPLWLPEGSGLLVTLGDRAKGGQLWKISYPQGQTSRLTNDLADYDIRIDATRNAEIVAAIQFNRVFHVWVAPADNLSGGRQITFGEPPIFSIAAAPQGKIVTVSRDGELLIMNADGSQAAPIPDVHNAGYPAACGRYFLYASYERGKLGLTRVDADGSNPLILVEKGMLGSPVCAPDLHSVFYVDWNKPTKVYRIPIEGGTPTVVADGMGSEIDGRLVISPDGKFLAYGFEEYDPEPVNKLAVIPVDGSSPAKVLGVPGWTFESGCCRDSHLRITGALRWSPDGKGLQSLVTRDGVTNIWELPLGGGKPKQLTMFTSGLMTDFEWFPDGKQLVLTRGELNSEVVLISNFR
jgi:DNA-binding winged helix-turn-helix (wHTH) protein/Tol biopolymer transport system component